MRKTCLLLGVILAGFPWGGGEALGQWPAGRVIDLTYDFDESTIYWPTAEGFRLEKVADGVTEKGYYYSANNLQCAEHGGTHLDAPIHFAAGRHAVDQVPLDQLIGPALVVDVAAAASKDPDYQVTVKDLTAWEGKYGRIPARSIILLRTGWGRFWPDRTNYLGTNERGEKAVARLHFPGLHPDAARWLTEQRTIKAIGLDTASIDYGQSTHFESHRILNEKNIPAFENVARLDRLPVKGTTVIALPMKIRGGSGAPLRIVAILPGRSRNP
ncbi:MAG: cyclase family protein [Acidobacteria bacterium]|nr:cyclase family protein [Acidobacteriota bacterium]